MDARAAADALQHWAEWHEALDAAVAAGDDELAWQLRTGHESVQEAAPRQLRTDAELDAVEAAIEARGRRPLRRARSAACSSTN